MKGNFKGNVIDYGVNETKEGLPQVFIVFNVPELNKKMTWYGSFKSEQSREITVKAILNCGFTGKSIADLAGGKEAKVLDEHKELELNIDEQEYNGKVQERIQWINVPYAVKNKLSKAEAISKMSGMNLEGLMYKIRSEVPEYSQAQTKSIKQTQDEFSPGELPF